MELYISTYNWYNVTGSVTVPTGDSDFAGSTVRKTRKSGYQVWTIASIAVEGKTSPRQAMRNLATPSSQLRPKLYQL